MWARQSERRACSRDELIEKQVAVSAKQSVQDE